MTWEKLDALPDGWQFDKTVGSPTHGYVFATNGKSVIHGQKRALVKVPRGPVPLPRRVLPPIRKPFVEPAPFPAKSANELARKKFEACLLADIRVDLAICEIEGWSKTEYIDELFQLLSSIRKTA